MGLAFWEEVKRDGVGHQRAVVSPTRGVQVFVSKALGDGSSCSWDNEQMEISWEILKAEITRDPLHDSMRSCSELGGTVSPISFIVACRSGL